MTQPLARYGVLPQRPQHTVENVSCVLNLADEFRERLAALHQQEHEQTVNYRNDRFPDLIHALEQYEFAKARIWRIEKEIKLLHSELRDRNAVTSEMAGDLQEARDRRDYWQRQSREARQEWNRFLRAFTAARHAVADWKNVKSLKRRRAMYAEIDWSAALQTAKRNLEAEMQSDDVQQAAQAETRHAGIDWNVDLAEYAAIWMEFDLKRRELDSELHQRGLHYSIRAEIKDATKPKTSRKSPGMRYRYGRPPEIPAWTNLTVQISGGLTVEDALAGKNKHLRLEPAPGIGKYRVHQRIGGSARQPLIVEYTVKVHRPLKGTDIIQRWTLVADRQREPQPWEAGKRETHPWHAYPLIKNRAPEKPQGSGVLTYSLSWKRRKGGYEVARFWSSRVNESLLIPNWIMANRMGYVDAQQTCDRLANDLLQRRGLVISQTPGKHALHGLERLKKFVLEHPDDTGALQMCRELNRSMHIAWKDARRAERCIMKIYETVASRVCRLHDRIVPDSLDLSRIKRYDTRDLLKEDRIPPESRKTLHALAIGKLKHRLLDYGLARVEEAPSDREVARETDVFSSWVESLGRQAGSTDRQKRDRSQSDL